MTEEAVLAEVFTVIRSDDDQRIVEYTSELECIHEIADLGVEVANAVMVRVAQELGVAFGHVPLNSVFPTMQEREIGWRLGTSPKVPVIAFGHYIRRMGIKIIKEDEERTSGLFCCEPV